jgi:FkbM family methyltransferase
MSQITDRLKAQFERESLRWILEVAADRIARWRGKGVSGIRYEDGLWIHHTATGYFAYHQPFLRLDMAAFDAAARNNFFWGYQPKPGDVILDVGAGVGEETLTFSRAVGETGRVFCVEAHPRTYACLQKLIECNRLQNVTAIHAAVTESNVGTAKIEDSRDYLGNRLSTNAGIQVPGTTLDHLCDNFQLEQIQFLKMNIEGAERFAIRGMSQTLARTEVACICCHDFLADASRDAKLRTRQVVQDYLSRQGLRVEVREGLQQPYLRDQVWGYNDALLQSSAGRMAAS